jgi:N-acylneuraminate cytidylyltransferase
MIQGKSILAIIPARGGSKGIPRKNIRMLVGKPLIAWTIEEAKKSKYIDRLILSSEDEEIIKVAQEWGCEVPFIRPAALANDETPGIEPILHAINTLQEKYDYVVLLQPTSPLRLADDIDGCIETCLFYSSPSCVSVAEVDQHPYLMYSIDKTESMSPLLNREVENCRRQDFLVVYILNGAVYVAASAWLQQNRSFLSSSTKAYIMPKERSLDIDDDRDLFLCEMLFNNKND